MRWSSGHLPPGVSGNSGSQTYHASIVDDDDGEKKKQKKMRRRDANRTKTSPTVAKDYDDLIRLYQQVMHIDVPNESYITANESLTQIYEQMILLNQNENISRADNEMITAKIIHKTLTDFFLNYASVLYQCEQYQKAIEMANLHLIVTQSTIESFNNSNTFDFCIRNNHRNAEAYAYIAYCYKMLADSNAEADNNNVAETYRKAVYGALRSIILENLTLNDQLLYMPRLLLGEICFEQDKFALSVIWFEKALTIIRKNSIMGPLISYSALADLHYNLGWAIFSYINETKNQKNDKLSYAEYIGSDREILYDRSIRNFQEAYYYYTLVNDTASVGQCTDWLKKLAEKTRQNESAVVKPKVDMILLQILDQKTMYSTGLFHIKQDVSESANNDLPAKRIRTDRSSSNGKYEPNTGHADTVKNGNTFYCLIQLDDTLNIQHHVGCQSISRKMSNVYMVEQLIYRIKEIVFKLRSLMESNQLIQQVQEKQEDHMPQEQLTKTMDNLLILENKREKQEAELTVVAYHGDFKEYCLLDSNLYDYIIESEVTHLKVLVKKIQ